MNIIKTLGVFLLFFLVKNGYAQLPEQTNNPALNELAFFVNVNNNEYANIEGSPYIFEDFLPCKINKVKETQFVRFNLAKNRIEIKTNDNKIMGLSLKTAYTISLLDGSSKKFETQKYYGDDNMEKASFFEILKKDKQYSLYKKEKIKFVAAKPEKSSYEPAVSAKFIKQDPVMFVTDFINKTKYLVELPKKKKRFFDLFGKEKKRIENFCKKEGLKFNREKDLITILNFYFNKD